MMSYAGGATFTLPRDHREGHADGWPLMPLSGTHKGPCPSPKCTRLFYDAMVSMSSTISVLFRLSQEVLEGASSTKVAEVMLMNFTVCRANLMFFGASGWQMPGGACSAGPASFVALVTGNRFALPCADADTIAAGLYRTSRGLRQFLYIRLLNSRFPQTLRRFSHPMPSGVNLMTSGSFPYAKPAATGNEGKTDRLTVLRSQLSMS